MGVMHMPDDKSYDVVVIGGGVTGSSGACFIASDSAFSGSVAVIECEPSYENSPSARATGGFRQQFSTPENVDIGLFGAHFVKHVGEYLRVGDEVPDLGYKEQGYLLLATPETLPIMTSNNKVQRAQGADTHMHTPAELASRFSWLNTEGLGGGCLGHSNEGWLDPYALLQAYRKKARSLGVTYVHDEVVGLETSASGVERVVLRDGTALNCGVVINAAGARGLRSIAALVDLALPIESRKRTTFVFECQDEVTAAPLTITPEGCAFRPEGRGFLVNLAPPEDNDPDTQDVDIDYSTFEDTIWPLLAHRVPAFEAIKLHSAYCCHYDVNLLDGNLIIDRHPEFGNFLFAGGFSGHGLQQSPAVGRALSELVVHGEYRSLDLSRFGYQRIASGNGVFERNCF